VQQLVSAEDVFAALAPNEAFVAISVGAKSGWTFLLRDRQIAVAPVTQGSAAIDTMVKRLRNSIDTEGDRIPVFDVATAHALYQAVLGGVAQALTGSASLVVAPTGSLLSIPFGVLLTAPAAPNALASAPWLLRQFAIAHVPSAGNFVALRRIAAGSRASHPWFGFGEPKPVTLAQALRSFPASACGDSARLFAGLPRLTFAPRELEAARKLAGGSPSDELTAGAFTVDAVRRAGLQDYRILHFATHALLPAELRCQNEPAIVASAPPGAADASGALLTAGDIAALNLDADLVIISACNSAGPGGVSGGESLSGLTRAFFYAGARTVLATHWSISDQSAEFLVAGTLRRLREGTDGGPAGAMRAAQLAMLESAGSSPQAAALAHPFFWAPFAVIGEGRGGPIVTARN
jgi:CHAT domain-containing protein